MKLLPKRLLENNIYDIFFGISVFIISFFIFHHIIYSGMSNDIIWHAKLLTNFIEGKGECPGNFLYYFTVYLFSGFNIKYVWISSIITLSLSETAKFIITKFVIKKLVKTDRKYNLLINIIAFVLLFVSSFPSLLYMSGFYYVGSFTANIWHNSTFIFMMPFSILLFYYIYCQLNKPTNKQIFIITVLLILNIFSKPSFAFVIMIVYPLLLLYKFKLKPQFWINIIPLIITAILVLTQYIFIYGHSDTDSVSVKFFNVFPLNMGFNIRLTVFLCALAGSFLFPVTVFIFNKGNFKLLKMFSLLICIVSFFIYITFVETGERASHGNFAWQIFASTFIMFMSCSAIVVDNIIKNNLEKRWIKVELAALSIHLFWGIMYLWRILNLNSYF